MVDPYFSGSITLRTVLTTPFRPCRLHRGSPRHVDFTSVWLHPVRVNQDGPRVLDETLVVWQGWYLHVHLVVESTPSPFRSPESLIPPSPSRSRTGYPSPRLSFISSSDLGCLTDLILISERGVDPWARTSSYLYGTHRLSASVFPRFFANRREDLHKPQTPSKLLYTGQKRWGGKSSTSE